MTPSIQRLETLKAAVLARGVASDVLAALEAEYADAPRQLAVQLLELRDSGTLRQRLQRAGLLTQEPEDFDSEWERNRPDPARQ